MYSVASRFSMLDLDVSYWVLVSVMQFDSTDLQYSAIQKFSLSFRLLSGWHVRYRTAPAIIPVVKWNTKTISILCPCPWLRPWLCPWLLPWLCPKCIGIEAKRELSRDSQMGLPRWLLSGNVTNVAVALTPFTVHSYRTGSPTVSSRHFVSLRTSTL